MLYKNAMVFFVCFFASLGICFSQEDNISAEGTGIGANADEALLAAKRDAIEKSIGIFLISQIELDNFQAKRDEVIAKSIGSMKSFNKISEGKNSDGFIEIKIRSLVSKTSLHRDLVAFRILIESMDKPRIMVVIDEKSIGGQFSQQTAKTAILQFLKAPYQFDCVDFKIVDTSKASLNKTTELFSNDALAAAIGIQNGADMILCAAADCRELENTPQSLGNMVSMQADVSLSAINCATGVRVGFFHEHDARVHLNGQTAANQAVTQASLKAIEKLLDAIIQNWQNQKANGITLKVAVGGVYSFRLKSDIIQSLGSIPNVAAVNERNWNKQSKILTLDLQFKGAAHDFCLKIDGYKLRSGAASVSVQNASGLSISLIAQAL